jgi:hypothetical protein
MSRHPWTAEAIFTFHVVPPSIKYLPMKGRGGNTVGIELEDSAAAASSGPKVMLS